MDDNDKPVLTRRELLKAGAAGTAAFTLLAHTNYSFAFNGGGGGNGGSNPDPTCGDVTTSQTEGPYFTPDSPERTNLRESDISGTPLVVQGTVLDENCEPVADALLDFWQAGPNGNYDNTGYRFRGHQYTDSNGEYRLETVVPGLYPGRTRHIHVKAQRPGGNILTTQLYFPDESRNSSDFIFDRSLLLDITEEDGVQTGTFDFVLS